MPLPPYVASLFVRTEWNKVPSKRATIETLKSCVEFGFTKYDEINCYPLPKNAPLHLQGFANTAMSRVQKAENDNAITIMQSLNRMQKVRFSMPLTALEMACISTKSDRRFSFNLWKVIVRE